MEDRYRIYSKYLKEKYGEKVYKLPLNLPLTCPNRDGAVGVGGCSFCADVGAGFESLENTGIILVNKLAPIKVVAIALFFIFILNFSLHIVVYTY